MAESVMVSVPAGGAELVADLMAGGYDWEAVGVFREKATGRLLWADDAGCSCNGPWEYMETTPDHFDEYEDLSATYDAFLEAAKGVADNEEELNAFLAVVEAAKADGEGTILRSIDKREA